jgi:nucleotide-binding universal stress UspA family protein
VVAVRRIIVGVHGSLGSLQALRHAADEARERCVPLVAVIAWTPPGGEMAERSRPSPYLRRIWREEAGKRLHEAFDVGLGGVPADIEVVQHVQRGESGAVLAGLADRPSDLLVIGTGRRGLLTRLLRHSTGRYVLAHARCPVLAIPPSALMDEVGGGHLHWRRRHRSRELITGLPEGW